MITKVLQLRSVVTNINNNRNLLAGIVHSFDEGSNRFIRQGGSRLMTIQNLQDLIVKSQEKFVQSSSGDRSDEDAIICIRSTDLQLQDSLKRERFFEANMKLIAFNPHLPWLLSQENSRDLECSGSNSDFIFYFDEGISDIICSVFDGVESGGGGEGGDIGGISQQRRIPKMLRVGGGFDYGFSAAYYKLMLYLDLKNEKEFIGNNMPTAMTSVESIASLSGFQSWAEIQSRNIGEKRILQLEEMASAATFEIELFMKELSERIFIAEPIKKRKRRLQAQYVNFERKREVAREFETWMYLQIAKQTERLRLEFNRVQRNRRCRILVTGRMANNPSFRRIMQGIAEQNEVDVIWQNAGYTELVPSYMRRAHTVDDAVSKLEEVKFFKNVSYGFNEDLRAVIQKYYSNK